MESNTNQPTPQVQTAPNVSQSINTPNQPFPPPKKPFPKIFLLAVLLIILFSAVYLGIYMTLNKQITNLAKTGRQTSQTTPTKIPTTDPLANWKTYKNDDFSFRYADYLVIGAESRNKTTWGSQDGGSMELLSQSTEFIKPKLGAEIEFFDKDEQFSLGGIPAHRYIYSCGIDCYVYDVYFKYKNTYYLLRKDIAGGGLQQSFEQTLSSFKFLDYEKTVTDSAWTHFSYGTGNNKFSLKYPPGMKVNIKTELSTADYTTKVPVITFNGSKFDLKISLESNTKSQSVAGWLEEVKKLEKEKCEIDCKGFSGKTETITIANKQALLQYLGSVVPSINAYLSLDNDTIFWAHATNISESEVSSTTRQQFLQILNTLEFTQ